MTGAGKHPPGGGQPGAEASQTLLLSIEASVTEAANSQGDRNAVASLSVAQRNRNSTNLSQWNAREGILLQQSNKQTSHRLSPQPGRQSWGGRPVTGQRRREAPCCTHTLHNGHQVTTEHFFLKKKLSKCIQNTVNLPWANRAAITMLHLQCSECLSFLPPSGCFWPHPASRSPGHTCSGSCSSHQAAQRPSEPPNSLSLKIPFPGREPEWSVLSSCLPSPGIAGLPGKFFRPAPSGFMGQEGGQLDLAVHGGSEAGPAVHCCAPVHGDHGGSVAAQAQAALQNLLVPAQL